MAKQTKIAQNQVEIYQGLDITKNQNACVVEDVHSLFYIFDNPSSIHILKEARLKVWDGIGVFMDQGKQTILCYHENLFKCNPDKSLNPVKISQYTWAKIVSLAVDRRSVHTPTQNGRKSTIGLCEYRATSELGEGQLKTPQAKACIKLFREVLASDKATATDTDRFVTEEVLRQYIIDHAAELHTKQDPWRIFQYYRPNLITEKLITRK